MSKIVNWGIMGTGSIAAKFATGLQDAENATLVGVGSRSLESANTFADKFTIPQRFATYEELVASPEIDVVYIASPHPFHKEHTLLALNAGKHVLCEKPFALNVDEAKVMIEKAQEKELFLMEAMWTRFFPIMQELNTKLKDGIIGEPRMLTADFGFRAGFNPEGRALNLNLGGGALLDVGIYPISLSSQVFGAPTRISSMAHIGTTGVDEQSAFILGNDEGQLSIMHTAIRTATPLEATIMGTEGRIQIESPCWWPTAITITPAGQPSETIKMPFKGNGYTHEAEAVSADILAGRKENKLMPLSETLSILETLDSIRAQWNLTYPMETN